MKKRYPDFIIAGVRKCGTTWLDSILREHPGIYMPRATKEVYFFDRYWSRGTDWYSRYFQDCRADQICGEVSPTYFTSIDAPSRIHSLLPAAKLIFVFRDPVEKLFSLYQHLVARGDTTLPLERALETFPELIDEGFYWRHLERFTALFPKSQIYTIILEEFRAGDGIAGLSRFLGVDETIHPMSFDRRVYGRRVPRSTMLARTASGVSRFLHSHGLHKVVSAAKTLGAKSIVLRDDETNQLDIPEELADRLHRLYDTDTAKLGAFLGRDLTKVWAASHARRNGHGSGV